MSRVQDNAVAQFDSAAATPIHVEHKFFPLTRAVLACAAALMAINETLRERLPER